VLLTDGEDNSSRHSAGELRHALCKAQREKGLVAIFLAANHDAIQSGGAYGFHAGTTLQYANTARGYANAWGAAWETLGLQQRCYTSRRVFNDRDRDRSMRF